MPRTARVVLPGYFYHITQRGNNHGIVFKDDIDRRRYLYLINDYQVKFQVQIFAYCLMNNHVHFIVRPAEQGFAKFFSMVHMNYAQHFNKRYKTSGHLWQGRFYSCILGETHFINAVRYVECNPVRAQLVSCAWDWCWSSAREHTGLDQGIPLLSDINEYLDLENWKDYLGVPEINENLDLIRRETVSGRVIGTRELVEDLQQKYGIKLSRPQRGRPYK